MINADEILDELLQGAGPPNSAVDPRTIPGPVADVLAGADEIKGSFSARAKREQKRFEQATDSEYWFVVCFQTREQKEELLRKAGLAELGDKYLDGHEVAEAMGIKLEEPDPKWPELREGSRRLRELT